MSEPSVWTAYGLLAGMQLHCEDALMTLERLGHFGQEGYMPYVKDYLEHCIRHIGAEIERLQPRGSEARGDG